MGSLVGEVTGANRRQARSAGKAARAKEAASLRQQDLAVEAASSPEELSALGRQLEVQESSLARQEKLLGALDPAILEASNQALALMRGEDAQSQDPIRRQRARQRQKLVDRLREQLGPGAESSSAGIQALQQFDFQTSDQLASSQSGALNQLFNIGSHRDDRLAQQAQGFGNVARGFGNVATRRANARAGLSSQVVNSAGSRFVESNLRAGQQIQMGADAARIAAAAMSGGASEASGVGNAISSTGSGDGGGFSTGNTIRAFN